MFEWSTGNAFKLIVTIYPTNITLNNHASSYFKEAKWCMVGMDYTGKRVAIKPISKNDIELNIYPKDKLNKVFLGKGYARISNKNIISDIAEMINCECNGIKFEGNYDEKENMLIIDMNNQL